MLRAFSPNIKTKRKRYIWFWLDKIQARNWSWVYFNIGIFFYYNNKIETYILIALLPQEVELVNEYKTHYQKFLPVDTGMNFMYKYNEQNILKPLCEVTEKESLSNISNQLLEYMAQLRATHMALQAAYQ